MCIRDSSTHTPRRLHANSAQTPRELHGNSAGTPRKLRGNSADTPQEPFRTYTETVLPGKP
eukprot:470859-Alexandrium_andersonii.AAC.1